MAIKLTEIGTAPLLVPKFDAGVCTWLPSIHRPNDGEDFSELLRRIVAEGHHRHRGMTMRDGAPAIEAFIRSTIDAHELRGRWVARDEELAPIADSSAPLLPLAFICKDGVMCVVPPDLLNSIDMRTWKDDAEFFRPFLIP